MLPALRERHHAALCLRLAAIEAQCRDWLEMDHRDATLSLLDHEFEMVRRAMHALGARAATAHGGDADWAARVVTRSWWIAQRTHAACGVRDWCRSRRASQWGLWPDVLGALWYHGWDVDPDRHDDVQALKVEVSRVDT